ncbi:hypothetical protein R1T16_12220 [Flavobacterium sp. DG1-102-2]|uniref:hypothetical protein n=1 Tax=Flavobacterium sp. DG1-102-2 TaxID=3081663 RepID=UPI00294A8010|nr:hypothetical protein [Flavobacterium sp. DG1-102-2]MDV6169192.1 hypothetical protein [Flavobacterium sp. DG1-102-2]
MESVSLVNGRRQQSYSRAAHASLPRWNQIDFLDVKRLEFKTRLSFKAWLWIVIIASIFINICLTGKALSGYFVPLAAVVLAASVFTLMMVSKKHFILFYMKDGSKTKIHVPKENTDYVRRFVSMAKRRYNK